MTAGIDAGLRRRVREEVILSGDSVDTATVARAVGRAGVILDQRVLGQLVVELRSELTGAGPLDVLLADPRITDILVNGFSAMWVDRGGGLEPQPCPFPDEAAVRALAVRLAARSGRRLDDANPCVDARLPTGERLHAVIPPISPSGTLISLRVPSRGRLTLEELVASGTLDAGSAAILAAVVAAQVAFLVSGGTGSGKTTILNALLGLVSPAHRIVIAEDTMELRPDHPHVVNLEARPPNVEGSGAVSLQVLVRQALRMRPDRLVVGEVRGAEIVELLGALNTGHEGGCGTIHANSTLDVPARVEALALAAGLPAAGARAQLLAGLELLLHVARDRAGRRVLAEVSLIEPGEGGRVAVVPALVRRSGCLQAEAGMSELRRRIGPWLA